MTVILKIQAKTVKSMKEIKETVLSDKDNNESWQSRKQQIMHFKVR